MIHYLSHVQPNICCFKQTDQNSWHYEILNELDEKPQSMRSFYLNLVNRIEMPTMVAQELVKILNKLKHMIYHNLILIKMKLII